MFKEGYLLYFEPFFFKNGSLPKNKFFIVVKNDENGLLLASLPTSKDHIPADLDVHSGVYEIKERGVSIFVFLANEEIATEPVTNKRFAFPRNTFLYAEQLEEYPLLSLQNQYESGLTKVHVVGILDKGIFQAIREFFKQSAKVRRKLKKLL